MSKRASQLAAARIGGRIRVQLRWVVMTAVALGLFAMALTTYDRKTRPPPERRVAVYFTHGCPCYHRWAKSLRAAGFVTEMFEPELLEPVRARLRVPVQRRGCHVAEYLGYFLDGHIPAESIQRLAAEHPIGLGLVSRDPSAGAPHPERDVLLVRIDGSDTPWVASARAP
jgi:hypothetical protein